MSEFVHDQDAYSSTMNGIQDCLHPEHPILTAFLNGKTSVLVFLYLHSLHSNRIVYCRCVFIFSYRNMGTIRQFSNRQLVQCVL